MYLEKDLIVTVTENDVDQAAYISELESEIEELGCEIELLQQKLWQGDHAQCELEELSSSAQDLLEHRWAGAEIELVTPARHGLGYLVTLRVDASPGVAALDYRPGRRVTLSTSQVAAFDRLYQLV